MVRKRRVVRIALFALFATTFITPITPAATAALTRSLVDRPDELTGPQVHLIYAVPSDAIDQNWDTSGQYKKWIDQAQNWLQGQVGRKLRFDTFQGEPDISFLRSKMSTAEMYRLANSKDLKGDDTLRALTREFLAQSPERDYKKNPKTYMFMVSEKMGETFCGYASYFSARAWGFSGNGCWRGPEDDSLDPFGLAWPSQTIVHEVFHTYGVAHTCDSTTELMWGDGCPGSSAYAYKTLDTNRADYYGSDKSGIDVSKLPIWMDGSGSADYAKLKVKDTYAPTLQNEFIFVISGKTETISWTWERGVSAGLGGLTECALSNGKTTITGTDVDGACQFAIPLSWRGGVTATATGKVWVGPFYGEVSTPIKLWNPDNYYQSCTNTACFVGESEPLQSALCYGADYKSWTLEQYIDGKWKVIGTSPTRLATRCSTGTYYEPVPIDYKYDRTGTFVYRWSTLGSDGEINYSEDPRARTILAADADYPLAATKDELTKAAALVITEAKKQAEADKVARELLRRQLQQCKNGTNCYVGETFTMSALCFYSDVGEIKLEMLFNNEWQTLTQGLVQPGASNCSQTLWGTPTFTTIFNEAGVKILRWKSAEGNKSNYSGKAYGILIGKKEDGEPASAALVEASDSALIKAKEVDDAIAKAKAEEEARIKAEAEAKAKAEAAAKAAAARAAAKKETITCVKGKKTIKVTGPKPVCPKGYKRR